MATLNLVLTQQDLVAALAAWVASPTGGSPAVAGVIHQMDQTVTPIINGTLSNGVTVHLNQ